MLNLTTKRAIYRIIERNVDYVDDTCRFLEESKKL